MTLPRIPVAAAARPTTQVAVRQGRVVSEPLPPAPQFIEPGKPRALQLGAIRAGVVSAYSGDSRERPATNSVPLGEGMRRRGRTRSIWGAGTRNSAVASNRQVEAQGGRTCRLTTAAGIKPGPHPTLIRATAQHSSVRKRVIRDGVANRRVASGGYRDAAMRSSRESAPGPHGNPRPTGATRETSLLPRRSLPIPTLQGGGRRGLFEGRG